MSVVNDLPRSVAELVDVLRSSSADKTALPDLRRCRRGAGPWLPPIRRVSPVVRRHLRRRHALGTDGISRRRRALPARQDVAPCGDRAGRLLWRRDQPAVSCAVDRLPSAQHARRPHVGRGFLWSDLVCYTVGVAVGVLLNGWLIRKGRARHETTHLQRQSLRAERRHLARGSGRLGHRRVGNRPAAGRQDRRHGRPGRAGQTLPRHHQGGARAGWRVADQVVRTRTLLTRIDDWQAVASSTANTSARSGPRIPSCR